MVDIDSKKEIRCFVADDETGEYQIYTRDDRGEMILINKRTGHRLNCCLDGEISEEDYYVLEETLRGNIKIVETSESAEFIRGLK